MPVCSHLSLKLKAVWHDRRDRRRHAPSSSTVNIPLSFVTTLLLLGAVAVAITITVNNIPPSARHRPLLSPRTSGPLYALAATTSLPQQQTAASPSLSLQQEMLA